MTHEEHIGAKDRHEAFVAHFTREHRRVHGYIVSLLPNTADADEVMQETSLILWRKWPEFREGSDFARFAFGIAKREVFKFGREKRRRGGVVLSEELVEAISLEQERQRHNHDERRAALRACYEELDEEQRRLLAQRYGEQTTTRALAEQLGRPASTLYKSLDRSRAQLRECIDRRLAVEEHRS